MAPVPAVLRVGLGVVAGALLLGACGLSGAAPAQARAEAASVALEFVHAVGRGDAVMMCTVMSQDYQEQGFADDDLGANASCVAKAASISRKFAEADRAELVAAAVDGIDDGGAGRVLVRTTGSAYPMTIEVIREGLGAKVDDSYLS